MSHRRFSLVGTALALVLAVLLAAGCGRASDSPPITSATVVDAHVITPAEALQVVTTYSAKNSVANQHLDSALTTSIEEGPLLTTDLVQYVAERGMGKSSDDPVTISGVHVYVPRGESFPAVFLADLLMTYRSQTTRQFVLFTEDSPSAPWRASFAAAVPPNTAVPAPVTDGGYATLLPVTTAADLQLAPSETTARYAAYLQANDPASQLLEKGPNTDGLLQNTRQYRAGSDLTFADRYAAGPVVAFVVAGGALVFGTVQGTETATPPKGEVIVQDAARTMWGGLVAPSEHLSAVSSSWVVFAAVVDPARTSGSAPSVAAATAGIVAREGVPCAPRAC